MTKPVDVASMRERLLNAAEQVVSRDGVGNLTLESVAREAGVSKGGLLYHFPSKSSLILAVVERLATRCETEQRNAADAEVSGPGAFTRAYIAARVRPRPEEERPLHTALIAAAGTDPQYLEPWRRRLVEWQQRLENDGIDPVDAMIARLAVDGLGLGLLFGMPVPEGELREAILDRLRAMTRGTPAGVTNETAS